MTTPKTGATRDLERLVMAHRYRYYVLADPAISDHEYDNLERRARDVRPPESLVHGVGSCLPKSYTPEVVIHAMELLV